VSETTKVAGVTPGPWKIWRHPNPGFGCEIRMENPPTVESVVIAEHVAEHDAPLLRAAPALLEALEAILGPLATIPMGQGGPASSQLPQKPNLRMSDAALFAARSAIALARGETP
jgi:hypothetical protein